MRAGYRHRLRRWASKQTSVNTPCAHGSRRGRRRRAGPDALSRRPVQNALACPETVTTCYTNRRALPVGAGVVLTFDTKRIDFVTLAFGLK